MKKVLVSSAYLPPIEWFALLFHSEMYIERWENFQKQTIRNRARILTSQGFYDLIVPIRHSSDKSITDTKISHKEQWQRQHCRTIVSAYRKAPYFEHYWPEIEPLLMENHLYLFDFNQNLIGSFCKILGVEEPAHSAIWIKNPTELIDLRAGLNAEDEPVVIIDPYMHVFPIEQSHASGLSILDLVFNLGPESGLFLKNNCHLSSF